MSSVCHYEYGVIASRLATRTGKSAKTAAEILNPRLPFSCLFDSFVSFVFCMKVFECVNLKLYFWKRTKIEIIYILPLTFSAFHALFSKDDDRNVTSWLHSHVKLFCNLLSLTSAFPVTRLLDTDHASMLWIVLKSTDYRSSTEYIKFNYSLLSFKL